MSCAKKSWALPARFWWRIGSQFSHGIILFYGVVPIVVILHMNLREKNLVLIKAVVVLNFIIG